MHIVTLIIIIYAEGIINKWKCDSNFSPTGISEESLNRGYYKSRVNRHTRDVAICILKSTICIYILYMIYSIHTTHSKYTFIIYILSLYIYIYIYISS